MIRQNRAIASIFIFAFVILGAILFRAGKLNESSVSETQAVKPAAGLQEQMGDPVNILEHSTENEEAKRNAILTLRKMKECVTFQKEIPENLFPSAKNFLEYLEQELGAASVSDRWLLWNFRDKEGVERRLTLVVTESDDGMMGRELQYFSLDKQGGAVPVSLLNIQTHNPSDETINTFLKDSEIMSKEKAGAAVFPNGEKFEFLERDGMLDEMEFENAVKTFKCSHLNQCECTN